jgi:HSP20 family protein
MYRRYRSPYMLREMDRLQQQMNRLYDSYSPSRLRPAAGFPAMNIWSSNDGLKVTAEVPGVQPSDIDINVVGDTLTLTGERKPDEHQEDIQYHRQERGYGKFSRSIQLPYKVNIKKVEATFSNGVLSVDLPRADEDKPRKIVVKTA